MATGKRGTVQDYLRSVAVPRAHDEAGDGRLLEQFIARKDESAFALLLRRHGPMVLHVGRRVLGVEQDAEDVFQATFLLLARKAASIRSRDSVASWLYGVAYRLARRVRQQNAYREARERRAAMAVVKPGVEASARELQEVLQDVLAHLPERYRTPLVLCYLEGQTQEEVARQLGRPLGTVRGWLARGRNLLRKRLARRGLLYSAEALAAVLLANAASAAAGIVPARLLRPTLRAALPFAAGEEAGLVSAEVAGLVREGLNVMAAVKFRAGMGILLALAVLAAGAGVAARQILGEKPPPEGSPKPLVLGAGSPQTAAESRRRTDSYGDPLPAGVVRRLGTVRFRHGGGMIDNLLMTPDGKTLVSNGHYGNRMVCVWELATGKLRHEFPGSYEHKDVGLSPDGKTLAVGQDDTVVLWDVATGKEAGRLPQPGANGFAFSPDGKTLAAASPPAIHLWDLATRKQIARWPWERPLYGVALLAFTPDGKTLIAGQVFASNLILWDVATGMKRQELNAQTRGVYTLALSPDGSTLATGSQKGVIPVWDLASGKLLRTLQWPNGRLCIGVAFAPDGKTLAAIASDDKDPQFIISLWDVAAGKELRRIKGVPYMGGGILFSRDGKTLFTGDRYGAIRRWDASTGEELGPVVGSPAFAGRIALSTDGRTLACTQDHSVSLWDMTTGREIGALADDRPHSSIPSLAFGPDGRTVAASGGDYAIDLWDVGSRKLLRRLQWDKGRDASSFWAVSVAFSPDGRTLASADSASGDFFRLWDVATGQPVRRHPFQDCQRGSTRVDSVAFSPDGQILAVAGRGPKDSCPVRLWDVATGRARPELIVSLNDPSDKGPEPPRFPRGPIVRPQLAFSPDGRMLALNRWQRSIPVWEVATGRQRLLLTGHEDSTACVAFSPDSRTLASAGEDKTIRLWDLETGKELRKLTGHRGTANSLTFSADGKTLVSTSDDTTILFWDVAAVTGRGRAPGVRLMPGEWETLWATLADSDAARAYPAMVRLMEAPQETVQGLKERLHPVGAAEPRKLARWLNDLDSNHFAVREKASEELEKCGESARPALEQALARPQITLESRRRLEGIVARLAMPTGERLQRLRAAEVLERIGTPGARQVLQTLAKGIPESRLTQEAKAALRRLPRE